MPGTDDNAVKFADFDLIHEGDEVELIRQIDRKDVERFAELTGDTNPLHLDDSFGARTKFGGAVAHGMLSASLISTVIGTMLPGPGALWVSQTLDFLNPVRPGDTITVRTRVVRKHEARRLLELHTTIRNQWNTQVIDGRSKVQLVEEKQVVKTEPASGKVALVTGASRGIGAAIARALASQNLKVVINYAHSEEQATGLVNEILEKGGSAVAVKADVGNPEEVGALFGQANDLFGPVDILVNNAWPRPILSPFWETKWEQFENQWNGGVRAAYVSCQAALPDMIAQKFGRIINIGSIAADSTPPTNQSAYVTAKAALSALTRAMAVELGPKGITVNLVAPGMTETSFISEIPQKARMVAEMQTPLRRLAQPEEIANVVAFLASPAASYLTGETVRVSGGTAML